MVIRATQVFSYKARSLLRFLGGYLDLPKYLTGVQIFVVVLGSIGLLMLSMGIRLTLLKFHSEDYSAFVRPWYEFIRIHGWRSFGFDFSDYNSPYLYLLYFASLLKLPPLIAIKGVSILFDLVLATGVYLIIRIFYPQRYIAYMAALVTLFMPTIFINSSMWGQCDSIYVSLLVLSFACMLRKRGWIAWMLVGTALSFKLQAVFFFPVLLVFWLNKETKWHHPFVGVISFLAPTLLPLAAGKPFSHIFSAYMSQASRGLLTANAPNLYQWIPQSTFVYSDMAGILFAGSVVLMIVVSAVIAGVRNDKSLLTLLALVAFIVPFLLPQMHERYFYLAEVASLILGFVFPRCFYIPVTMQLVTFFACWPFLFRQVVVPLYILSFFVLAIICILAVQYGRTIRTRAITPEEKLATE